MQKNTWSRLNAHAGKGEARRGSGRVIQTVLSAIAYAYGNDSQNSRNEMGLILHPPADSFDHCTANETDRGPRLSVLDRRPRDGHKTVFLSTATYQ